MNSSAIEIIDHTLGLNNNKDASNIVTQPTKNTKKIKNRKKWKNKEIKSRKNLCKETWIKKIKKMKKIK